MKKLQLDLLILILITACSEGMDLVVINDDASIQSINGTWKVLSFENFHNNTVTYPNEENSWNKEISITFDDSSSPHQYSGRNITNSIFGEFHYTDERGFEVERMGTTYVGQPELGNLFARALLDDNIRYEINSTHLRIYFDEQMQSVTLERQ
ncbi:MAG: hypothetical protein RIC35_11215 [Marinoscillum sp.]